MTTFNIHKFSSTYASTQENSLIEVGRAHLKSLGAKDLSVDIIQNSSSQTFLVFSLMIPFHIYSANLAHRGYKKLQHYLSTLWDEPSSPQFLSSYFYCHSLTTNTTPTTSTTIAVVGLRQRNQLVHQAHPHHNHPTPPTPTNSKLHDRAGIEQNSKNKSH